MDINNNNIIIYDCNNKKLSKVRNKGISLLDFPDDYIVIDIETTGFSPTHNEIIEIGALKVSNGEIIDKYSTLIRTANPLSEFIVNLTGITDEMLASEGIAIEEALIQLLSFVEDSILVGHNIHFDINFIYDAMEGYLGHVFNNDFVDSFRIAKKMVPNLQNHRLGTLAKHFGIDHMNSHRAIKDCEITNLLFIQLKEKNQSFSDDLATEIYEAARTTFLNKRITLKGNFTGIQNNYIISALNKCGISISEIFYGNTDYLVLSKTMYKNYFNKNCWLDLEKIEELKKTRGLMVVSEEEFYSILGLDIQLKEKSCGKVSTKAKDIVAKCEDFDEEHPLYNKTCVFTGTLDKMPRSEAMQLVANLGGFNGDAITKSTNYLILGNTAYISTIKDGKTSKQKKAEKYILEGQELQIIPEELFYEMINYI